MTDADRELASAPVVIVGAGPVGLMLAFELGRAGVRSIVLELADEPSSMPKGNGLVGEIATVLKQRGVLRGERGLRVLPLPRYSFGPVQLRLNPLRPNPLRVLPIPQQRLEQLLERHARAVGADIRRGCAVTGFRDEGGQVVVEVASADSRATITADFLAGCDGAHSFVRHRLGVDFPGTTSEHLARLGRVRIPAGSFTRKGGEIELADGRRLALFRANHSNGGSVTLAPVADLDRGAPRDLYLVSTHEARGEQQPAESISLDELGASIRRVLGFDLPMSDGQWMRSTVGNSRQAERYRVGHVFLAGDAAHVFPAGGSALNTGMLDAVDLAARLAEAHNSTASEELLEGYHTVRHAAGRRTMLQTRAQAALSAHGENADALREVLGGAFHTRNPNRYLAELLIGKD